MTTRHWKEKLVAVVIAFFFWNTVKQQIHPTLLNQRAFVEEHALKESAGLEMNNVPPNERRLIEEHSLRERSGIEQ